MKQAYKRGRRGERVKAVKEGPQTDQNGGKRLAQPWTHCQAHWGYKV